MNDTVAALATAPGEGGIAVIRISGEDALRAALAVFRPARGKKLRPRVLTYGKIIDTDGNVIDEAMTVYMPAPHTYTREDVCEIQCHGGRTAPARVLGALTASGLCRTAQPGEFTKRAFLNGRIDLSEAEAVMGVIRAGGEASARAAQRQLSGGMSAFVSGISSRIEGLLALVSAATDFPDETDEAVTAERVLAGAEEIRRELERKCDPRAAKCVREGVSIVLAGRPNVGKSSLLNAIAGADRAIVSSVPGTTRDVLTERITRGGIIMEISDTAGQRDTGDGIEALGVERARRTEDMADCVLLVLDAAEGIRPEDETLLERADGRFLIVVNKTDIGGGDIISAPALREKYGCPVCEVSAVTGGGIDDMLDKALDIAGARDINADTMTVARHIECAGRACECLKRLEDTVKSGAPLDIVSGDLWQAMYALSEITGRDAAEDVIDRVFADFCVGK